MVDTVTQAGNKSPRRTLTRGGRSPFSRLSLGHVVMIAAGLLSLLLNVLVLRQPGDLVSVPVAGRAIVAGSRLAQADISLRSVEAVGPFIERAVSVGDLPNLWGEVVVRDVDQGAPLMEGDIKPRSAPGDLRAMRIPVSGDRTAGANLDIGDLVDVVAVRDGTSRFVATGLEVIAIGGTGSGALAGSGITVGVSPVQALLIASALDRDTVHILRSTGLSAYRGYPGIRQPNPLPRSVSR